MRERRIISKGIKLNGFEDFQFRNSAPKKVTQIPRQTFEKEWNSAPEKVTSKFKMDTSFHSFLLLLTSHVVVHGGQYRDGFLGDVDPGKDGGRLTDARQPLGQQFRRQMV